MAISKCKELIISRKRFSDFTIFDPVSTDDIDNVFVAGYMEDESGNRENIKMKASSLINKAQLGKAIGTLNPNNIYDTITFTNERMDNGLVKVINIDSDSANFIQINTFKDSLFYNYNDKSYIFFRLSPNLTFGTVIRFYFPNFPKDKGVMFLPTPGQALSADNLTEVFFNASEDEMTQEESDFYFTVIQLADPQNVDGSNIVTKTKVIEVTNITNEI